MAFLITNTQEVLRRKPGAIHPVIRVHLAQDGNWSVTRKPKTFLRREAAQEFLLKEGLAEGRHEDSEENLVNTIAIEEDC